MRIAPLARKPLANDSEPDVAQAHGRHQFLWGFLGQVFSSATNFGVVLIAGRLLGPAGLGMVVIGLGAYQLVAGLQRAFVAQPIIAYAAPLSATDRRRLSEAGLTIVAGTGAAATLVVVILGLAVNGSVGHAMLIVAPWLIIGSLQDYWKAIMFQEGLGLGAAASDCARLVAMCLLTAVALEWKHDYAIVASWGIAALIGLAVAIPVFPMRPKSIRVSVHLWRQYASKLGLWLGAREVVNQTMGYVTIVTLALVIGTRDLGGLRSAEALFSPWSLIAAALVLPALPALSRAAAVSHREANRLAVKISIGAISLGTAYFLLMALIGSSLLPFLFGSSFAPYNDLVYPMGIGQLAWAATYSFNLLLSAERRGAAAFAAGAVWAFAIFAFATTLAATRGVTGAAWGTAIGVVVGSVFVVWLSTRRAGSKSMISGELSAGSLYDD